YKHFAPLGLRPQNPLVPETFKSFAQRRKERERRVSTRRSRPGCRAISALLRHFVAAPDQCAEHTFLVSVEDANAAVLHLCKEDDLSAIIDRRLREIVEDFLFCAARNRLIEHCYRLDPFRSLDEEAAVASAVQPHKRDLAARI